MRVFFGLGGVKLLQPTRGEKLREWLIHIVCRERDLDGQASLIFGHREEEETLQAWAPVELALSLRGQLWQHERLGQFAATVRAEVEVDDAIAVLHQRD